MSKPREMIGWMRSTPGLDSYSMFVNEYPNGGFEWSFLDYEPKDAENYRPIYISLESNELPDSIQLTREQLREAYNKMVHIHGRDNFCSGDLIDALFYKEPSDE